MKRRNTSIPELSVGLPRRGFSTPSPVRPVARINNSPTLFFGDIGSFDVSIQAALKCCFHFWSVSVCHFVWAT